MKKDLVAVEDKESKLYKLFKDHEGECEKCYPWEDYIEEKRESANNE